VIRLARKLLQGGRNPAGLPLVLALPRASASLTFRSYREPIGPHAFIAWWCERMRLRIPDVQLHVMCHAARDAEELTALAGPDVTIIHAQMASRLHAVAEIAAHINGPIIAVALEGLAFAPPDLAMRVHAHHLEQGNRHTPVSGLPNGAGVELFDTRLLAELARAPLPPGEEDPTRAMHWLLASEANARAARVAWPVRAQPFDAGAAYGVHPGDLPEQILFASPREMALARDVMQASGDDSAAGPLDDLRRWRAATIAAHARARETLRSVSTTLFPSNVASTAIPSQPSATPPSARRVLFVSNASAFSGGENSLCQLAAMLDRQRFQPHAILGGEGLFAQRLRDVGVDVRTPGGGFGGEHGTEDLAYVAGVFDEVRPDLVHVNSWPGWPLLHLAQLARVPIVAHCRNVNVMPQREVLLASDRIITVSDFVKRQVLRLEVPDEHVRVIYNSVNTELFDPALIDRAAARARLGVPPDARLILTIARYAVNKRHDLLLDAVALARRECPRLHLMLCGEILGGSPAVYDRVMKQLQTRQMMPWVTLVPFTEDIRELHAAANALVLCSDREPLGRCVLEAMAMARPPIVTNSSGNHEVLDHGVTGFIVPANDAAALARQIVQVMEDEAAAARAGAAARAHVRANLDGRESARQVMALYDELIATAADQLRACATGPFVAAPVAAARDVVRSS
jgi:glycosyltransferase involved in cell wall biosynthesis